MEKTFKYLLISVIIISLFSECKKEKTEEPPTSGTFIDTRDNHEYKWIKIGKDTWMAENLAYKTNSGCWAYNNEDTSLSIYGYLYTLASAKEAVPEGWHIATGTEWDALIKNSGGYEIAGGNLKETGIKHWKTPNGEATNSSNFSALPGGYRSYYDGSFYTIGEYGYWWCYAENDKTTALVYVLNYENGLVFRNNNRKDYGYSVRCVKNK